MYLVRASPISVTIKPSMANNKQIEQMPGSGITLRISFYFAYFFETREPRFHKAFWFLLGSLATLQFFLKLNNFLSILIQIHVHDCTPIFTTKI